MTQLLFQSYNETTRRGTEIETDAETGHLVFTHTQDLKPIVEQCKRDASNFDKWAARDTVRVASIPLVIWRQLQRLGITNDEAALNAWLNDRDNRVFRTDDCSQL